MFHTYLEMIPSSGGANRVLSHVSGLSACAGAQFYTVGSEVRLCPDACSLWRADQNANIDVIFTCTPQVQP